MSGLEELVNDGLYHQSRPAELGARRRILALLDTRLRLVFGHHPRDVELTGCRHGLAPVDESEPVVLPRKIDACWLDSHMDTRR